MADEYRDVVLSLLDQAEEMERGPGQTALAEEAVRLADAHNDEDLGFWARGKLMKAATFGGEMDKALVAFAWCLGKSDSDPGRFAEHDLLWKYKWAVQMMSEYPQFSKPQLGAALDDMTRRYERAGSTFQTIFALRFQLALNMGDEQGVRKYFRLFSDTPRDDFSNSTVYERRKTVEYHRFLAEDAQVWEKAKPILAGKASDADSLSTFAHVLLPLLRLGQGQEAARCHRRGFPLVERNPFYLTEISDHITFLAVTGDLDRSVRLVGKHLAWTQSPCTPFLCFYFYLAALFVVERLARAGKRAIKLRLSTHFTLFDQQDKYPVEWLQEWFAERCRNLSQQFDQRNENTYFSTRVRELQALHDLAEMVRQS